MSSLTTGKIYQHAPRAFFYFIKATFIADLGLWILDVAGTVSEFALLVAVVFISVFATEKPFVNGLFGVTNALNIFHGCITLFIMLPEIIALDGIVKTFELFKYGTSVKSKSNIAWAVLFGIPTVAFLILTVITLISTITPGMSQATTDHIVALLMVPRALSVFLYAVIKGTYRAVGAPTIQKEHRTALNELRGANKKVGTLQTEISTLQTTISNLQTELSNRTDDIIELQTQVQAERQHGIAMLTQVQDKLVQAETTSKLSQRTNDEVVQDSWLGMQSPNARKVASDTGLSYNSVVRIVRQLNLSK